MIQRNYSLGNTEDLANITESKREFTKITTEMCSGMRSTAPQYLVVAIATTRLKDTEKKAGTAKNTQQKGLSIQRFGLSNAFIARG